AALRRVVIHRFDPATYRDRALQGLQALLQPFDHNLSYDGPIAGRFTDVVADVDALDRAVATHGDAGGQLRRLSDALAAAQAMLADPDFAWVLRERVETDPEFARLLHDIGTSAFFGSSVQQQLQDRANLRLRQLQGDLA